MSNAPALYKNDCHKCDANNIKTTRHLHKDYCPKCYATIVAKQAERDAEYRRMLLGK